jgi:hypothetical protein
MSKLSQKLKDGRWRQSAGFGAVDLILLMV